MTDATSPIRIDIVEIMQKFDPDNHLSKYLDLLEQVNQVVNLVSRETSRQGLEGLVADSLIPFQLNTFQKSTRYLDIGSGGGFPSIPILLSTVSSDLGITNTTLVERTQKKARALTGFIESLNLSAEVIPQTLQDCKLETTFDLITLKYVKLTPSLFRKITNLLKDNGCLVHYSQPNTFKGDHMSSRSYLYTLGDEEIVRNLTIYNKKLR